jgi:hypothetical protein
MSAETISMRELEAESAELLPSRETLCYTRPPCCHSTCAPPPCCAPPSCEIAIVVCCRL